MYRFLVAVKLSLMCAMAAHAGELQNFFVAPLTTELHRATVSADADAYAVVNCNGLIANDEPDLSKFDKDGFLAALVNAADKRKKLRLVCRYQVPANFGTDLRQRLNKQLKQVCREAGYETISATEMSTSADWRSEFQNVLSFDQPLHANESLFENELVRAYPIQTQLSKHVHGDADCMVKVFHPIDGHTTGISTELASSIRQFVEQSNLGNREAILFKLSSTEAGSERVDELFNARRPPQKPDTDIPVILDLYKSSVAEYKPSAAMELALNLGFERIVYSHSPGGGAPELLVGKEAPSFNLPTLDGGQLDLHEFRAGRPALVTFWGLACGPCRIEAPHLTQLHQRHGQDFAIVAVNGYDDDRDSVAKYVANDELSHPIVLNGGSTADESYHVGAYPTTFWLDRDGTVIEYEVGFTSAKRLENHVLRLME
ncbi:TlpA family protein disulfide reductase [Rhodopirellula sp. MGV]|uniref:TlpA family protein disulfide reductase n=1 Tax=Rhodopirellula sp. MGV TaxID=2023130 RepID=UPI000B978017|nr:TlpA disulfide reductase family protein [Rhodopirellula sp. MGV]OYP33953.1 hypothetical protein CGZ80_17400 [Rhodopirellula sp. MGV]PNY34064.1 TlpA family protein disulfide reductase [Rhodopirellula baltica]